MATADHTTSEKKMSKTVNIVCYLKADSELEEREMMDTVDSENDYYETDVRTKDKWFAVTPSGVEEVDKKAADVLKDAEGEQLMVAKRTEEIEYHKLGPYDFKRTFKRSIFDEVDPTPPSVEDHSWYAHKVETDDGVIFKARAGTPTRMGLLKHPSAIEDADSDSIWRDEDADMWAMTLTVEVDSVTPTLFRYFDRTVVPHVKGECATHDWVARTRVMDCSKEMTEEGACYDVF